jgi:hypothetical protein
LSLFGSQEKKLENKKSERERKERERERERGVFGGIFRGRKILVGGLCWGLF